jgi:hypothetical protein
MADAIDQLTTSIVSKAKQVLQANNYPYEVWNRIAPSTTGGDAYVLVTASAGSSQNVKQKRIERINATIAVYARSTNVNADAIAGILKDAIVDAGNNVQIALDNPNMKVIYLNHSDNAPEPLVFQGATFINRFVTINFQVVTNR